MSAKLQTILDTCVAGHMLLSGARSVNEMKALIEQQRLHIGDLIAQGLDTHHAEMLLSEMERTLAEQIAASEVARPYQRG